MMIVLTSVIILSAIIYHRWAIQQNNRFIRYLLKPGTILLIILLAIFGSEFESTFSHWVVIALIFSCVGDVFLMFHEKWFLAGLVSFLLAHLLYSIGIMASFTLTIGGEERVAGVLLLLVSVLFFYVLYPSVKQTGGHILVLAVAVYIIVIATMVWLAVLTNVTILILAALLFFISDAILALDRFKQPFKWAEHLVMSTYFAAQLLFALSISV